MVLDPATKFYFVDPLLGRAVFVETGDSVAHLAIGLSRRWSKARRVPASARMNQIWVPSDGLGLASAYNIKAARARFAGLLALARTEFVETHIISEPSPVSQRQAHAHTAAIEMEPKSVELLFQPNFIDNKSH